ncbi:hypothetical protein FD754_024005, partial [Muntiacus muntjak]
GRGGAGAGRAGPRAGPRAGRAGPGGGGAGPRPGPPARGLRSSEPPTLGLLVPPSPGDGERRAGKHYGVYSCEGCKGFFKRTVRKDLTYTCRDNKDCLIDKRQRNRCQYCRYQKCLAMGMKREAVQEERQRGKDRGEGEVESTSSANEDMPVEKILEAELAVEPKTETYVEASVGLNPSSPNDPVTNICQAADKQLFTLVEWAKRIPHFSELPLDDQVILLRADPNPRAHRKRCQPAGLGGAQGPELSGQRWLVTLRRQLVHPVCRSACARGLFSALPSSVPTLLWRARLKQLQELLCAGLLACAGGTRERQGCQLPPGAGGSGAGRVPGARGRGGAC